MNMLSVAGYEGADDEKKARTSHSNSKETSESSTDSIGSGEMSDNANDEDAMPPSLQTFLAHFGVLSPSSHNFV